MRTATFMLGLAGTIACFSALPRPAHAGIDACGDIHVEANAECEVVTPGIDCESMCTPLSVRAACSASLAADCRGECPELPSVECSGSCMGDCMAECDTLDPGTFDCPGSCQADCSGRCSASCQASEDRASCEASCEGSCSASCEGSCEVEPPEADCEASCEASCEGSCEADANFECQVMCQARGYADCEGNVQGGCEVECMGDGEGALFCDGEYVDHGNNLEECIDALQNLELEVHAEAEASGHAEVSSSCAISAPGQSRAAGAVLWGSAWWLLAGLAVRRRRT